jgi:hypothetical protein
MGDKWRGGTSTAEAGANAVADIRTSKHSAQVEDNDHNGCVAEQPGH